MKKVLNLTLTKKWFDLIVSGRKRIEYREYKPYWISRIDGKDFDEICFKNGYGKNAPYLRVELKMILVRSSWGLHPAHGEELPGKCYVLCLGNVLEINNWKPDPPEGSHEKATL